MSTSLPLSLAYLQSLVRGGFSILMRLGVLQLSGVNFAVRWLRLCKW